MSEPRRVARRAERGWRMPNDCRYVGRPTRWANPPALPRYYDEAITPMTLSQVRSFRCQVVGMFRREVERDLAGLSLCCWCRPDAPCHADVLLEIANPDLAERPWVATWGTATALVHAKTVTSALVKTQRWSASVRPANPAEVEALTDLIDQTRDLQRVRTIEDRREVLNIRPAWHDTPLFA